MEIVSVLDYILVYVLVAAYCNIIVLCYSFSYSHYHHQPFSAVCSVSVGHLMPLILSPMTVGSWEHALFMPR